MTKSRWCARCPAVAVVVFVALLAAGCGQPSSVVEAKAETARASTSGVTPTAGVTAVNGLAADLYQQIAAEPGNMLFSPYSVVIALAMVRNGAKGDTRTQIDEVLRASNDDLDQALNLLDAELASRPGHKGNEVRNGDLDLETANALFGQEDTPFEQPFLESLARHYGAGMLLADYKTAADAAREEINQWAADRTNDKIVDLLPDGALDSDTRLVLTNAVYFKAPWAKAFHDLGTKTFTRPDGSTVQAPAMSTSKIGTYREGPGWRAAEIPYLGDEVAMSVIVPDDLASFEDSLDGATLGSILSGPSDPLATLQMPKFTFRSKVQLREQLSELGMPLAFSDRADFSGITKAERLTIADVFHQAYIAVDEEGTEAAAATADVMEQVSGPCCEELVVDRPFLFAIHDVATETVLFLGRVSDPTTK